MSPKPRDKGKTKEKPDLNTLATKRQRAPRSASPNPPAKNNPATPKINVATLLKLRYTNRLTLDEIAQNQGVTKQAVSKALKKFGKLLDAPKIETGQLAHMFEAAAVEHLCAAVEPTKVKKLSADKNALSACMLLDKSRLISGQSTQNIAVMMASAVLEADRLETESLRGVTETATEEYTSEGKTIVVS